MRISASKVVVLALVLVVACSRRDERSLVDSASAARDVTPVVAGQYTLADFQRLRWLDGRWRGFQPDGKTFYEQYRVLNDSTIAMVGFADSTFGKPADSSRV